MLCIWNSFKIISVELAYVFLKIISGIFLFEPFVVVESYIYIRHIGILLLGWVWFRIENLSINYCNRCLWYFYVNMYNFSFVKRFSEKYFYAFQNWFWYVLVISDWFAINCTKMRSKRQSWFPVYKWFVF